MRDMSSYGSSSVENTSASTGLSDMSLNELVSGMTSVIDKDGSEHPGAFGSSNADLIASYEETILTRYPSVYGSAIVSSIWQICRYPNSQDSKSQYCRMLVDDITNHRRLDSQALSDTLLQIIYPGEQNKDSWEFLQCRLESAKVQLSRTDDPVQERELSAEIEYLQESMTRSSIQVIDL